MLFSNPKLIIEDLKINNGDVVADLGAGTGHYSLPLSKKVGSEGKVYALEANPDIIERLKNDLNDANASFNVEVIKTNIETPILEIPENTCDWIICANVFFTLDHKNKTIETIKNLIKNTGKVLLVDWTESFSGMGPQPDHLFTEVEAVELFKKHNFSIDKRINAGSHHYGIVFKLDGFSDSNDLDEEILLVEDIENN